MSDIHSIMNPTDDYDYQYHNNGAQTPINSRFSPIAPISGLQQDGGGGGDGAESDEKPAGAETAESEDISANTKVSQESIINGFERIKTHFPAARIKKIMQSDEDIGKVAQATPVVVGRALEIFMANLVEASIIEAKKNGVKRIGASHIRSAVENTEQFDFLVDAVEKYPAGK